MWGTDTRPRFGLICCVNDRGLGTEARNLKSIFERYFGDYAFSVYRLPTGRRAGAFDASWESHRGFRRWLERQQVVMSIEVFMPRVFAHCRARGIRSLWRPNQEWIDASVAADAFALVDEIVTPQRDCAALLRGRFGLSNVRAVPWILDRPVAIKAPQSGPVRFLFNAGRGGVGDRRHADLVVAGMAAVLRQRQDIHLTIKTQSALNIDALRPYLGQSVEYVHKNTGYARNLAYYGQADFSLAPSKWEGLGFALLESLHAGTPVLSVDAPPMNEWIDHQLTGYLLPVRWPDVELPIARSSDNSLGINWVRAALADPEALAAGVNWLADHRQAFYAAFNRINPALLSRRKGEFLRGLRAAIEGETPIEDARPAAIKPADAGSEAQAGPQGAQA